MTLKKALIRGLLGFPLGVFICVTLTLIASLIIGTGKYYSVAPELIWITSNEVYAFMLQYILSGVLGFAFAAGSAIFEIEHWSIIKQTATHFLIGAGTMFPVAYICGWMERSILGVVSYVLVFLIAYILLWFLQYTFWKKSIYEININLKNK